MKKLIPFLAIVLISASAYSQRSASQESGPIKIEKISKDTTNNVDTSTVSLSAIGSGLTSIDAAAVLVSGTIGGKIYLYGGNGLTNDLLDSSAVLTATKPNKIFLFDKTKYTYYINYTLQYRTTTNPQKSFLVITACRRPDEN